MGQVKLCAMDMPFPWIKHYSKTSVGSWAGFVLLNFESFCCALSMCSFLDVWPNISNMWAVVCWQELSVTDDTVLEEHNEDPALVQMKLIGDGGMYLMCACVHPPLSPVAIALGTPSY